MVWGKGKGLRIIKASTEGHRSFRVQELGNIMGIGSIMKTCQLAAWEFPGKE